MSTSASSPLCVRITPTTRKRAVNRRARQTKNSGNTVVTMTQSEAFASRMTKNDRSTLVGKIVLQPTNSSPTAILAVQPLNMGARAAAFAALFAEYHVNYIRIKFLSNTATPTTAVLGFLDDAGGSEGDGPGSLSALLEYRSSAICMAGTTIPVEFVYTQKASAFWLKTYTGVSGSDIRLSIAAILFLAQSGSQTCNIELDFSITFQGAVDVSSS
jgi:hypothetical protein